MDIIEYIKTNKPPGFFVTGTDTDIGKTYVGCHLAKLIRQELPSLVISPRKPVTSGCLPQKDGSLLSADAYNLQLATASQEPLATICPYLFEPAISPARAIKKAGKYITLEDLVIATKAPKNTLKLVEGAGGIYSPISSDGLNIDFAKLLNLPIILVVGNKLGCLNQALLSIEAIQKHQLEIANIYLNDLSNDADPDNLIDLKNLTNLPVDRIPFSQRPLHEWGAK